jgi:NitT/TauT family transport system ATP-binding protein
VTFGTPFSDAALSINGVAFAYDEGKGDRVLQGVTLRVPEGTLVSLVGPSGSGKSTLLRLIAGLARPSEGHVSWKGRQILEPGIERAIVFQNYALFPWFSAVGNVAQAVAKAHSDYTRVQRREKAFEYLERVGISDAANKYPHELSGGMQQRAAIARALALEAPILLMDEPFGALDPINRGKLQDLLLEVWQSTNPRRTIVFVTHDVDEALYLGDRIAVLGASPGRLLAEIDVPFARPRHRGELFSSEASHKLRKEITELLGADVISGLGEALFQGAAVEQIQRAC